MKRKNLVLAAVAAAVLGAFNPVLAGGDKSARDMNADVGVDASASIGSTDINAGANVNPGVNVGSSGDQSVSSGLSASESTSASSTDVNRPSNAELSAAATASITEAPDSGDKKSLN